MSNQSAWRLERGVRETEAGSLLPAARQGLLWGAEQAATVEGDGPLDDWPREAMRKAARCRWVAAAGRLASAADRPDWLDRDHAGEPDRDEPAALGAPRPIVHPLSGKWFEPPPVGAPGAHRPGSVEPQVLRQLIQREDARLTYLAFWRFLPEARVAAGSAGAWWSLLPADVRVPDRTIWSHMDLVAALRTALAADAGEPHTPALLAMSFGPVQSFISQARSTSDLWAGSHLLASLVAEALLSVCEAVGPDAVIFPAPRGLPAVDRWLVEQGGKPFRELLGCTGAPLLQESTDTNPLFSAALPSKLVAIVPSHRARQIAEQAAERVRKVARMYARQAAQAAFAAVNERLTCETRAQIEAQLAGFPQVAWAAVDWPLGDEAGGLGSAASQVCDALRAFDPALADRGAPARKTQAVLSRPIELHGQRFWTPNAGILYPAVYDLVDRALAAAKTVRPFDALVQHGYRCSLTGEHEWLTERRWVTDPPDRQRDLLAMNRRERSARSVWGRIAKRRPSWAKRGEHLGAVATLKRLWPELFAAQVEQFLGDPPQATGQSGSPQAAPASQPVRRHMVSTHALAASTTIERLLASSPSQAERQALEAIGEDADLEQAALPARIARRLDERLPQLEPDGERRKRLRAGLLRLPAALERSTESRNEPLAKQLAALRGSAGPETYYAVLLMDGDRMGRWLSGLSDADAREPGRSHGPGPGELTFGETWEPRARAGLERRAAANSALAHYLRTARPGSPARHLAISQALGQFSMLLARYVVEDCFKGKLLYAGGDDVLALVAVDDLPGAMQLLRLAYSGIAPHEAMGLQPHAGTLGEAGLGAPDAAGPAGAPDRPRLRLRDGFGLLDGRLMQLMGERATASMGAVIAHYAEPLPVVLRSVREAEQQAKAGGRDAFCLRVLKRGGPQVTLRSPWWPSAQEQPCTGRSALALMQRLVGELAGVEPAGSASDSGAAADAGQDGAERERAEFSRRALFNAQFWLQGMTDRPGDAASPEWRARMAAKLRQQFVRQQGSAALAQDIVDFVCDVMRPEAPRSAIEDFLAVGEFLGRQTRAFAPAGAPGVRPGAAWRDAAA